MSIHASDNSTQPLLAASRNNRTQRDWKKVTHHIVLFLLCVGILAVIIEGFIDAGDVEVFVEHIFDLQKALKAASGGGPSGAAAMVVQVLTLMPLRTVMNFQYRFGTTTSEAIITLYADGGWTRYYNGLAAALIQNPAARFGDTVANAVILALLQSHPYLKNLPALIKAVFPSVAAAAFRMVLTPVDTIKTTMQTQGSEGLRILRQRISQYGIRTLWNGAFAIAAVTFVGHYPWFSPYKFLEGNLPEAHTLLQKLFRRAFIGFVSSVVSDSISNSLRVVKTYSRVILRLLPRMHLRRSLTALGHVGAEKWSKG